MRPHSLSEMEGSIKVVLMKTDVYKHYTEEITMMYVDLYLQAMFAFTKSILCIL